MRLSQDLSISASILVNGQALPEKIEAENSCLIISQPGSEYKIQVVYSRGSQPIMITPFLDGQRLKFVYPCKPFGSCTTPSLPASCFFLGDESLLYIHSYNLFF
jgi:hypothetical protein